MASPHRFDPLAATRENTEFDFDLLLTGSVSLDIIFTGLDSLPEPGTETWADGMGSSPGGIANQAIAASRLGLRTSLASAFGDDAYGDFNWDILENQEHVDLSRSQKFEGWHSPVTVSMSVHQDRSMVTHGHPSPVPIAHLLGQPPRCRAAVADVVPEPEQGSLDLHMAGTKLFGSVGWDPTETWPQASLDSLDRFHAFMPNTAEAMAYTRTDDPWRALYALADKVPVAVVTLGHQGAMAVDSITGEEEWVPTLPVNAYDPTGAGDCFTAAFIMGDLAGWKLADRLAFANLCAGLSVQEVGGSLAAPGWGDIADWWTAANRGGDKIRRQWLRRYGFLEDILAGVPREAARRASATVARYSDAGPDRSLKR